jgi:hypothetical protein
MRSQTSSLRPWVRGGDRSRRINALGYRPVDIERGVLRRPDTRCVPLAIPLLRHSFEPMTTQKHISLASDARGSRALQYLEEPIGDNTEPSELCIRAGGVGFADAFTGAVMRANIERQLRSDDQSTVVVWPPSGNAWGRFHDLLGPLPPRCAYPNDVKAPQRDRSVILPAQPVTSMDQAHLLARWTRAVGPHAGISVIEAKVLALGIIVFADNGLRYASDSSCAVVLCATADIDTDTLCLTSIDLGIARSTAADQLAALRTGTTLSRRRFGGLTTLGRMADEVGLTATVSLSAGAASAELRAARWRTRSAAYVAGFAAGLTVQR